MACDFLVAVTARFRILFVFVALEIGSRLSLVKMLSGLNAFGISNIHGGRVLGPFVVGKQCNNVTSR